MPRLPYVLTLCCAALAAQAPLPVRDAAALQLALDKLQVVGTVLYVAAHPDDENTAVLACLARGRKVRAAYLSMTRGGGGQNLIGTERGDNLALLRTQELLAARRLDGAEQFFTRAVDFGYSKTPEETLAIWGHDAVLADVVWTIRKLRPDVIITRFSPTMGGTHGHHTASAMLALEAFKAAADPSRFPEQLAQAAPWQATRIVWNSFRFNGERPISAGSTTSVALDVGRYDPLLGKAYTELAAESRSMHRSQGFGAVALRGARPDYFEPLAGTAAKADLLEGLDLTWGRIPGGAPVGALLEEARRAYQPEHPEGILPLLAKAKAALERLAPDPWVLTKRLELSEAMRCAAGLWVEAMADHPEAAPGETLAVTATALARGGAPVTLVEVVVGGARRTQRTPLPANEPRQEVFQLAVPAEAPCSQPYWLGEPRQEGLHSPAPLELTGLPEGPPALRATFRLEVAGAPLELTVPVQYRFRDPVLGERYQSLAMVPPAMVNLDESVQLLPDGAPRQVQLSVLAGRAGVAGKVRFQVPAGWRAEPAELPFTLAKAGDELKAVLRLTPPATAQAGVLRALVEVDGATRPARSLVRIAYPHLPPLTVFPLAEARIVRVDLRRAGRRLGYVMGAGDELPQMLRPLGYQVDLLSDELLASADLSVYDAILVGIRAFNTRPRLAQLNARLLDYVAGGGTEVVQYNVDQGLVVPAPGPFPMHISRQRVVDEAAPVTLLAPDHPALNWPNAITQADFQGWVQERGLYFADTWAPQYTPLLACADAGEKASSGALLVAPHGKGHFVYTGLAFFRQLPDGVPGAYRLLANLLALGQRHD